MFLNSADLELNEESVEIVVADEVNETTGPEDEQDDESLIDASSDDEASDDEASDD